MSVQVPTCTQKPKTHVCAGYYMYTEASSRRPGDKARLLGPTQPATQGKCLRFFYHMKGAGIGTLNVFYKSQNVLHRLWTRTGQAGSLWHGASVTITANFEYQVGGFGYPAITRVK